MDGLIGDMSCLDAKVGTAIGAANFRGAKTSKVAVDASQLIEVCGTTTNAHAVRFRDKLATIIPRHPRCDVSHKGNDDEILIASEEFDVALYRYKECPTTPSVLVLPNMISDLLLGDEVVAGGYVYSDRLRQPVPRIWTGTFTGTVDSNVTSAECPAFTGCVLERPDMCYFTGVKLKGMSGAPVLNRRGYLGMAVGTNDDYVSVVPNSAIYAFLEANYHDLADAADCETVTYVDIPTFPARSC